MFPSADVKENLASRKDCPAEVLLYLAQTNPKQYGILREILHHPNSNTEVLSALAKAQDFIVRIEAQGKLASNSPNGSKSLTSPLAVSLQL